MAFSMTRRALLAGVAATGVLGRASASALDRTRSPNVVVIYADDLGYGDIGCYGATAVKTPNIDRLAAQGVRFTNGHASAATCTPSRYALLTGRYAWRQDGAHILPGDAPALIRPGTATLPSMLRSAGYRTGVVGKWHLGLGDGRIDWNRDITPGPLEIGFDQAYFIPATIDRVPCVYVEGRRVVGLDPADPIQVDYRKKVGTDPTGRENPEMLRLKPNDGHDGTIVDGVSRIGFMSGGQAARWKDEEMADHLARKATAFIKNSVRADPNKPFFLYFAPNEVHVPRLPASRFRGATTMGPRGDVIAELDWCVGEVMRALTEAGVERDTLVIFSSDNGPVLNDGYDDEAVARIGTHRPAGSFRSGKYSIYDGGTRVPMIVRWPAGVKAGGTSSALIDHVDLTASLAVLTGQTLAPDAAVDSFDMLPALLGRSAAGRRFVIEEASTVVSEKASLTKGAGGSILALVEGGWKLIRGNGGATAYHGNAIGAGATPQLFDLSNDPAEANDLAAQYPDRVLAMDRRLAAMIVAGRTRPQ
jgi:arylsulfatase A-like enzyme